MIASTQPRSEFLQRVSVVHTRNRRVRLTALVAGAAFAWLAAVGGIAVCDFLFEMSWMLRAGVLGVATLAVAAGVIRAWSRERERRSPTRTAAAMETAFPDLGQRARTAVQFGGRTPIEMRREGVRPELVDALVQETSARSADLPLDEVIPRGRLWATGGLLLVTALALALGCVNWEWRRAMSRTLLGNVPYTELTVTPGDVTVQTGAVVGISVKLAGRTDRDVIVRSRDADSAESAAWTTQPMLADAKADGEPHVASLGVWFEGIERPQIYQIDAGSIVSPEYRIDVLDPLTIHGVTAEVEYPAYTRLPMRTFSDGAISALRGSICRITVELSREPQEVRLSLQELPTKSHPLESHNEVSFEGTLVTLTLPVERNLLWTLSARTADGVSLADQPFRIRVTEDRPPKLAFDDPDDGIEVHTLAELPMRARASDDYGLTRSGIIFEISGSEEFTLLEEHFDEVLQAIENAETQTLTPRTRSVLERLLPLEHFALTQKDSVMYYAFAEDSHPVEPQRTESDRRFIDIRPFVQTFRRVESEGGGGGGGPRSRLRSLGELIRRERSILNWTIKLTKRSDSDSRRDVMSFDRLMRSQAEVADLTRLLAERFQERGIDDVDAYYQAEAVMLEAIDSLSVGDLETAVLQEKDAQQYLVEGRNRLEILISNRPTESIDYQALRDINAMILQRLRRRPNDNNRQNREAARLIVSQLMRWARSEEEIARQLAPAAVAAMNGPSMSGATNPSTSQNFGSGAPAGEEQTEPEAADDAAENSPTSDPAAEDNDSAAALAADGTNAEGEGGAVDFEAMEERQFEILADARELAGLMGELEAATDLAQQRMAAVTEALAEVAEAIEERDAETARTGAVQSARDMRELARQINGLTQGDVLERIAFSRNLSTDLTRRQRRVSERLDADQETVEETANSDSIATSARDVVEKAVTLEDVLQAISNSMEPDDGEAADRVKEAIEDRDLSGVRRRLGEVAEDFSREASQLGASSDTDNVVPESIAARAAAELRDTADSTERLAADLDQIYRELLTPVIERLRDLEQQAADLAERMDEPDNERQGGELVEELEELIQEMELANAGGAAREQLDGLLRGRGGEDLWDASAGSSDRVRLRAEYRAALRELLEELQLEIQELVLADTDLDVDSPVPLKYEPLVDRYLKVLSRGN